jgi:hypothetical protein
MEEIVKKNLKQIDALHDPARFKFWLAGRRGGKTFAITEDIVKTLSEAPRGADLLYLGPTLQQAKELIWEPLEERLYQLKWAFEPRISKSRFELTKNRKVYVLGAEKISRIRGHKFYKAYLDELAFFEKDFNMIWRAIRPALSDHEGGAILATTPDGKGSQAYDVYLAALQKPEWGVHSWKTIDNPHISSEEIEAAKTELDEHSFRQEYEATWESFAQLAYYNMDENLHIKPCGTIDINKPIHLCFDFNVNPTSLIISQRHGETMVYKKEYSEANSSTEDTVKHFCEEHKDLAGKVMIKIRGDSSGKNRSSNTGRSDYHYVEEMLRHNGFQYQREVPSRNPPIIDRVKYVNGWLKPMAGGTRIMIDPSCTDLIRDLTTQGLDGRVPSKKNNLGHKADALGYDIYWEHINSQRAVTKTIQL